MSSFRQKNTLVSSLENLDEVVPGDTELVPATAAEVEAVTGDVNNQEQDIEQLAVSVEEAEADETALTDVADNMQESVDSGEGMSEEHADMAEIAVESICQRLGFSREVHGSVLPSMESFKSKGSRLSATKIALESVMDRLKTAGKGIVEWLKQLWEKVKSFVSGLLNHRGMLDKHLKSLKEQASKLEAGLKKKEEKLKIGAAGSLSVDGKADATTAATVLSETTQLLDNSVFAIAKMSDIKKPGADGAVKVPAATVKSVITKGLTKVTVEKGADGAEFFGHLTGTDAIGIKEKKIGDNDIFELVFGSAGKKATEIDALDQAGISRVVTEAQTALKGLQAADKIRSEADKAAKAAISALEAYMKVAETAATGDDGKAPEGAAKNKEAVAAIRSLSLSASRLASFAPGMSFKAIKASADYAAASIRNLKGEEAAKPEADKK